jgi:hypothetical protein
MTDHSRFHSKPEQIKERERSNRTYKAFKAAEHAASNIMETATAKPEADSGDDPKVTPQALGF